MRQVEKHIIKYGHEWFDYCTDITTISQQLYNTAQFTQRQGFFYGWGSHSQAKLDSLFKQNENYKSLPAKVAQLVLKQNADAWIGLKIHADVNGAFNIGRKSNPEGLDCLKSILRDRGCLVVHPRRITPLFRRERVKSGVA